MYNELRKHKHYIWSFVPEKLETAVVDGHRMKTQTLITNHIGTFSTSSLLPSETETILVLSLVKANASELGISCVLLPLTRVLQGGRAGEKTGLEPVLPLF